MTTARSSEMNLAALTIERADEVRRRFGTPCYVYDRAGLEASARRALAFPAPFGFTLRYEGQSEPGRADPVPRPRAAHRRVERLRGRACPARRLSARHDPAHLPDALAPAGRVSRARRGVQRLFALPTRGVRPPRPRLRGLGQDESRARQRID